MAMWPSAGQFGIDKTQSKLAWSRTKRMMQNRHQWEVRDLRKSGLNPILSAGAAPSMGTPPQPARSPELAGAALKGAQKKLAEEQTRLPASTIDLNRAGAANQYAQANFADKKAGAIAIPGVIGGAAGDLLEEGGAALRRLWESRDSNQTPEERKRRRLESTSPRNERGETKAEAFIRYRAEKKKARRRRVGASGSFSRSGASGGF